MLQKFYIGLLRFPLMVVLICATLIMLAGYGIRFLHFKSDNLMFFSADDPQLIAFQEMQKVYSRNDNVFIVLSPKNGDVFTRENLEVVEELTQALWKTPYSTRVDSITNFQHSRADGDDLAVSNLVSHAAQLDEKAIAEIRNVAVNEPLLVNRLLSSDAKVTGINVKVDRPGKDQENETAMTAEFCRDLVATYQAKYPDMEFRLTGSIMLDSAFAEASRLDLGTLTPAMLSIVAISLLLFLRSFTGTFAALFMMTLAIIAAVGLAGWMGIAFSPSSVPAPTILLTLAVADAVHVLTSYYSALRRGLPKKDAMIESMLLNFKAIFFTNLTTAIGFLSMNFSDAPPFHDLGNITAMGVAATYLLTILFLPALMMLFPARVGRQAESVEQVTPANRLAAFVIRYRKKLLVVNVLVVGFFTCFATANELNDNFVKYFDSSVKFRQDTDYTDAHLTGIYNIEYSLVQGEEGGVNEPAFLQQVDAFVQWYRQQPEVLHVFSVTDIHKRLNKNMHGDDPAYYKLAETREMAAQFLLLYEMSLPYGLDLNDSFNVKKSSTKVTVTLRNMPTTQILALEERAQAWLVGNANLLKGGKGTGTTLMFSHISERNILSMITGELVSMSVISLILMLVLRSFWLGLISLIPNLVPAGMAFGIWGLVVGQVGMACSVVAAMTLGILVDDTVHFLSKYQYARDAKQLAPQAAVMYAFSMVGSALWITSVVLILGFSLFIFSSFRINYEMGILTAIIFALGLFAEFILLPPVLLGFEDLKQKWHQFFNPVRG